MPHLETPAELAEWLADQCYIYETDDDGERRPHWVSDVTERIRESVKNEQLLREGAARE